MLRFPGKIPITIHPVFWLLAGLIGWFNSGNFAGMLIWIVVILVSVLVHELGHALTAVFFGKKPQIQLIAVGGATIYETKDLKFPKEFLIVFNGPLFGFLLFLASYFLLYFNLFQSPLIINILSIFKWVNFFWTILNLIPVMPLDGGQLLRIILEGFFGLKGYKAALFIGMAVSLAISFFFFIVQHFLIGALFFLFAFQSFDLWRRSRFLSLSDRKGENAQKMKAGEDALREGRKEDAQAIFQSIRDTAEKGVLFVTATYYLAVIAYEKGDKKLAYTLLAPVKEGLEDKALCLLQELAFDERDYDLVAELSAVCYKAMPSEAVALRNARAFGFLKKAKAAGGWLQTAMEFGKIDFEKIIKENFFERVKDDPLFKSFFN